LDEIIFFNEALRLLSWLIATQCLSHRWRGICFHRCYLSQSLYSRLHYVPVFDHYPE